MAFAGDLTFNPLTDSLKGADGKAFKFSDPSGFELPPRGYDPGENTFQPPPTDRATVQVAVDPKSDRLQLLEPFKPWDGKQPTDCPVLIKVKGKCSKWLSLLEAGGWKLDTLVFQRLITFPLVVHGSSTVDISKTFLVRSVPILFFTPLTLSAENCLIGAINIANGEANKIQNLETGEWGTVPATAAYYRDRGIKWVVIGDHNYGEGSSREHAALEPRFLGGLAIIVRSFARIHETNLKKQGMLALTFVNPDDYDLLRPDDRVDIKGLEKFAPGVNFTLIAKHLDGTQDVRPVSSMASLGILTPAPGDSS